EPIVRNITRMGEKPASTYVPPDSFPGFKVEPGFTFDVKRARQFLADSGVGGARGGPTLPGVKFMVRTGSQANVNLAQNIVNQWRTNLGIDIGLELVEPKIARQRSNEKDFSIMVGDWIGDYQDPSTFTDKYRSNSVN